MSQGPEVLKSDLRRNSGPEIAARGGGGGGGRGRRRRTPAHAALLCGACAGRMESDDEPCGLANWFGSESDDSECARVLSAQGESEGEGEGGGEVEGDAGRGGGEGAYETLIFETAVAPPVRVRTRKREGIAFQLWPAAEFLCRCVEEELRAETLPDAEEGAGAGAGAGARLLPRPLSQTRVVELGAGVGLVGLFLAAAGAREAVLTDLEEVTPILEANIALNAASEAGSAPAIDAGSVRAVALAWGTDQVERVLGEGGAEDVLVVAADCVYWEELLPPLEETLHRLCEAGATVLLAQTRRFKKEAALIRRLGRRMDLALLREVVQRNGGAGQSGRHVLRLYRLSARGGGSRERRTGSRERRARECDA